MSEVLTHLSSTNIKGSRITRSVYWLGYGLNDQRVRFASESSDVSLLHSAQNASGVYIWPLVQWILTDFFRGLKRPGNEAHHSPQSSAKFKKVFNILPDFPLIDLYILDIRFERCINIVKCYGLIRFLFIRNSVILSILECAISPERLSWVENVPVTFTVSLISCEIVFWRGYIIRLHFFSCMQVHSCGTMHSLYSQPFGTMRRLWHHSYRRF